ncbi:hypothetical protein [Pseudodonghicola flavimaris]|uniref:Sulfotransferase domain-containing protein n=1 Tax=Pseudodonghicola flavimaris TaxID=3050036 RepID=A0ABT7EX62_9RHOB|nr:hypothetical protein [Pseudodonghicola flavimaris]MDK3016931.1 hypothetical protein [Pseudodonghicola flavimaris]
MARLMCIATHHKGGTVWIKRVVRALSHAIDVPWIGLWSDRQLAKVPEEGRAFLCNWNGRFPRAIWDRSDVAFLHLVRDPRDILLSGCGYHLSAPVKGEKFLHQPRADLGGATYQEHLNALADPAERLLFEMENKHAETLAEMRAWPWGDPRATELRYEALMADRDGTLFGRALTALGLKGAELAAGLKAFWDNSLFGGLSRAEARTGRLESHIASAGRLQRWRRELPRAVGEIYADRFGADLIALGYEKDTSWVETLPVPPAAA